MLAARGLLSLDGLGSGILLPLLGGGGPTLAATLLDRGVFESSYLTVVGVTTLAALVIILAYGPRRFARPQPLQNKCAMLRNETG
ncbi:MAG: hypothetical protein ABIJ39_03295 [Chloroflexota bacterium]